MNQATNIFTAPTVAPSNTQGLASANAILVNFSCGVWNGRKADKTTAQEVAQDKGATKAGVTVYKALLGDCQELDNIAKFVSSVRKNIHMALSQPWFDNGARWCALPVFINKYQPQMSQAEQDFTNLVQQFLDVYDIYVADAAIKLGDMYDPSQYMSRSDVAGCFYFTCHQMAFPMDVRIQSTDQQVAALVQDLNKQFEDRWASSMKALWEKLYVPLDAMVGKLAIPAGTQGSIFRDTLVDNIKDALDLLDGSNITGDVHMAQATQELRTLLQGVHADALRHDPLVREETRKKALQVKQMIDNLPGLGW